MLKNQKGITLIALVITIIVLLILAGVSIAMLTGPNGLLTRAEDAGDASKVAEAVERVNMELQAQYANVLSGKAFDSDVQTNLDGYDGFAASAVVTDTTNPGTLDTADTLVITITSPAASEFNPAEGSVEYTGGKWVLTPVAAK